jgi:DNA-binding MarR family transcriptional regulator
MMTEQEKYERCLHDLAELLQKTSAAFQGIERRQTRLTGFTSSQSFLLMTLFHDGPLCMGDLADRMGWDKSTLTRIAMVLERDGLVEGIKDTSDRRVTRLSLTTRGSEAWQLVKEKQRDYYTSIIAALPRGHVREVMDSAALLYKALLSGPI